MFKQTALIAGSKIIKSQIIFFFSKRRSSLTLNWISDQRLIMESVTAILWNDDFPNVNLIMGGYRANTTLIVA